MRGGATCPSLKTGADTLSNPTKGSATPYQEGSSFIGAQSGFHQDVAENEFMGVLDLPGDHADSGQASGTTEGIEGENMGGQAGTSEVPDIFLGQQTSTGEVSRRFH